MSKCGKVVSNERIIGGQNAVLGSWPWQATLKWLGSVTCGGSLISNQWVLTAAHCISNDDLHDVTVHLGVYSLSHINPTEVTRSLDRIICHPEYNDFTLDNDICLLKLSAPVNFTEAIKPICLAGKYSTFNDGLRSWITGFGMTGSGSLSNTLQEAKVPIVGNNRCSCYLEGFSEITNNMICAGLKNGGKDSCQYNEN
ncbi:chymotrypsin-like protease CTRL-1 [Nematolebias whitei]|uniref:chymotrypsin-like protease CTRL-1 n=1 Tax=Nematolebias whitei TaxID=451745 RepID=UPI00189A2A39|nr:chymotrypsin-like protease CTRL-1 [Nematolebias whitei]